MKSEEYIGKVVEIVIDRKLGTYHPKHKNIFYEVNYGFIPNTVSGDNEELDCYLLGVNQPVDTYKGVCIAVLRRTNDDDDKLIVVPEGMNYSDDEINKLTNFQEQYFKHIIIR